MGLNFTDPLAMELYNHFKLLDMLIKPWIYFTCILFIVFGCTEAEQNTQQNGSKQKMGPSIHLIIDTSAKQLAVLKDEDTVRTYPIAVGTAKYPTPTGNFKIHQIDWNPDWTPPEGDWAKNKEYTPPSHPDNPMGRVRIVYQMPYTIHGTKDLQSLGEAESHGSVRMANADVIELAKFIMKESGTEKGEDWYKNVLADSAKMVSVKLQDSIPLTNRK